MAAPQIILERSMCKGHLAKFETVKETFEEIDFPYVGKLAL
jgi:hypothetical protein